MAEISSLLGVNFVILRGIPTPYLSTKPLPVETPLYPPWRTTVSHLLNKAHNLLKRAMVCGLSRQRHAELAPTLVAVKLTHIVVHRQKTDGFS